ncbi:prolyl oligopeptidase family serine peptidase [Saccharicrinis sp. GN24d3]|uniref:prolyl oligopeptidase family serine peptidase n=1 Tax=Saccharicrinis sp. GN24d3 TaxID=3458416 RepID=UPI004037048A
MKNILFAFVVSLSLIGCQLKTESANETPPIAATKPVTENYFGKEVTDPYRYMENLDDSSVINWFKTHSEYSRNILDQIPGRQGLIDKMKEFDQRKSSRIYNVNITEANKYFYLKQTPDDETGKLFYRDGLKGDEVLLFDPATYKDDTLHYSISSISPSIKSDKVCFEVAPNGSESSELMIMNVETRELYPEVIDRCWFSAASWLPDDERFIYIRLNSSDIHHMERELNSKSFIHTVGQSPENDIEFFSRSKNPELDIKPEEFPIVFYDRHNHLLFALLVTVDKKLKIYMVSADEMDNDTVNWKQIVTLDDQVYNFETIKGQIHYYTPKNAPNFKLLKAPLDNPLLSNAKVFIPEDQDAKLANFTSTSDGLYYILTSYGVQEELYFLANHSQKPVKIELPTLAGRIGLQTVGINTPDVWVTLNGWTTDYQRYRYLPKKNKFEIENLSDQASYPEYTDLIIEELMVRSHDGVTVPLSVIYNKNITKDGNNPVFLFGYGAYGYSINPFFSPNFLLYTTKGGILGIPHVRGGGELGDNWHKAGHKTTKPNTWKDLIACAEYLIDQQFTSHKKISIYGGSAGGILIGRAMTERPDLFATAIAEVGCMNTMRGEFSPNGPVNIPEFGTVKDSVECMALYEMDSYHHIVENTKYPATLITAGMNDPRVIAWQPAKFAARLQAVNSSDKPILFLVDFEAGHGIGDSKSKYFNSLGDVLGFALWQSDHSDFQPN